MGVRPPQPTDPPASLLQPASASWPTQKWEATASRCPTLPPLRSVTRYRPNLLVPLPRAPPHRTSPIPRFDGEIPYFGYRHNRISLHGPARQRTCQMQLVSCVRCMPAYTTYIRAPIIPYFIQGRLSEARRNRVQESSTLLLYHQNEWRRRCAGFFFPWRCAREAKKRNPHTPVHSGALVSSPAGWGTQCFTHMVFG